MKEMICYWIINRGCDLMKIYQIASATDKTDIYRKQMICRWSSYIQEVAETF